MQTPMTTREAVLATMAQMDAMGEAEFLKAHGYGPSKKYRVMHAGRSYPSKAVLGVAAGLAARDFSGGASHTARVLTKLGFEVHEVAKGAIATVLAVVAGVALSWPFLPPEQPEMPVDPSAVFASGANHPGEIRAFAELGHDVGVAAPHVTAKAEAALVALAGTDVQVFVDSGAFSEVEFGPEGVMVVKPIGHGEWVERLELYERLAVKLGHQVTVVAPDMVGNQDVTLERLERYAPVVRKLADLGARVLVPVQKGAMTQADFWAAAVGVLGCAATPAMPCKKAATTVAEVRAFCKAVRPTHLHLLGLGLRNANAKAYLQAVREEAPGCQVTVDSNVLAAHVGNTGGPDNGPRRVTLARRWAQRLVGAGRLVKSAVAEFATLLAFGGRDLGDEEQDGLALSALGDLVPRLGQLKMFGANCDDDVVVYGWEVAA